MTKEEFECNIKHLLPSLKALVYTVKKTRYFGYYDANDLLQEILIRLYNYVPQKYSATKGTLKNFCLKAAKNHINNIARTIQRHHAQEISVDWNAASCQQDPEELAEKALPEKVVIAALRKNFVSPQVNRGLFRMHLEDLAKVNKDFNILYTHYNNGCDTMTTCKELGICRVSLGYAFNRVKQHRLCSTLKTHTSREAFQNKLTHLTRIGVSIGKGTRIPQPVTL